MIHLTDEYLQGYIQALIDSNYQEFRVTVTVRNREVWVFNLPKNSLLKSSIATFIRGLPGVAKVHTIDRLDNLAESIPSNEIPERPVFDSLWFPQTTELFLPLIASPRQVMYSVGYRRADSVIGNKVAAISFGDDFPLYRLLNVFNNVGDLQFSLETGVWAVFNVSDKERIEAGTEFVNADYYVGFLTTFAINSWSFRSRIYHLSSHLGDEFLVNNPQFVRVNPSFEAVDIFGSYQHGRDLRLYLGVGVIFHSDPSFRLKPFYTEYGWELRTFGKEFKKARLFGNVFVAGHLRSYQYLGFRFDGTFLIGYEWSKFQGIGRKFRLFMQYHSGFSVEGQFSKQKSDYFAIKLSYGF